MDNPEYNRMIYHGKLKELSEINNLSDLTRYQYLHRDLLEYLLEKNIHTTRMDSYAKENAEWLLLYLKYNIKEPLLNTKLDFLLKTCIDSNSSKNRLYLDILLENLNTVQRIKLYNNIIKENMFLYRIHESQIIKIFKKYHIDIKPIYVNIPEVCDCDIKTNEEFNELLEDFKKIYFYIDEYTLNTYVAEFKRKYKNDRKRAFIDLKKIIEFSRRNQRINLRLLSQEENQEIKNNGEYISGDVNITINRFFMDTFSHELSHYLFWEYEGSSPLDTKEYNERRKIVNKAEIRHKIINYLTVFHECYEYTKENFEKLYYAKIDNIYGSLDNYKKRIMSHFIDLSKPFKPFTFQGLIENNLDDFDFDIDVFIQKEKHTYAKVLTENYYREELMLENLLDALLLGKIFGHKLRNIECLSGHKESYFKESKSLSFNEVLADYDSIKNSPKKDILIPRLREIIGDDFVDFLDKYIKDNRESEDIVRLLYI